MKIQVHPIKIELERLKTNILFFLEHFLKTINAFLPETPLQPRHKDLELY